MSVPLQYPPLRDTPAFLLSYPSSSSSSSSASSASSGRSLFRRNLLMKNVGLDNIVGSKSRRPKFDLIFQIIDLNNVPLVSGNACVKWSIESSPKYSGRTELEPIKDHKVAWGYAHEIQNLRLYVGRNDILQDQHITFTVIQEHNNAGKPEKITLGTVRLNLAEYVGVEKETRRYLMQSSKINSTLKIGISMTQTGGEGNYITPFLRTAQVFSGIAGIIGTDQRDQDDARSISSVNSRHRDPTITSDIYRRTLAASWGLQAGELNAEECIDDIFAGGDGWTPASSRPRPAKSVRLFDPSGRTKDSDSDSTSTNTSTTTAPTITTEVKEKVANGVKGGISMFTTITVPAATGRKRGGSGADEGKAERAKREVDEVEVREDFVSWRMPGR